MHTNFGNHEHNRLQSVQQLTAEHKPEHLCVQSEDSVIVLRRLEKELSTYFKCRSGVEEHRYSTLQNSTDKSSKAQIERNELSKNMNSIKVQMDVLNLTTAGCKSMALSEVQLHPIFTMECRLSNELIRQVPRYDMFNIMQFECDKFQISKQSAKFYQSCIRQISLPTSLNKRSISEGKLGFLHFTVWWRESGSCLNEMLGMGTLHLTDCFYKHSTLKQYKRIVISRHGLCLAYLYVKISILINIQQLKSTINLPYNSLPQHMAKAAEECDTKATSHQIHVNNTQAGTTHVNAGKYFINSELQKSNSNPTSTEITRSPTKVPSLKGFICVNEMRQPNTVAKHKNVEYYLKCRCFWQDETITRLGYPDESYVINFDFFEQFPVVNDEKFLSRVERQHLELEIWRNITVKSNTNDLELLGIVRLSLHQFFIAFRDEIITSHLCKGKLPVISVDGWVPMEIGKSQKNKHNIELKCLLAVGSEEQINNLRQSRGLNTKESNSGKYYQLLSENSLPYKIDEITVTPNPSTLQYENVIHNTANLNHNPNHFTIELTIRNGKQFPMQFKKIRKKKAKYKSKDANKLHLHVEPSTYVSFQAHCVLSTNTRTYKSNDGYVFATKVVEKTTQPQWQETFTANIDIDYLHNKNFILKIWQKNIFSKFSTTAEIHPTPLQDEIIGFATLNLQAFIFGNHVDGYIKVIDINGSPAGLLNLSCRPLETISELRRRVCSHCEAASPTKAAPSNLETENFDTLIPSNLEHLNLGQAVIEKMCELEEISLRLRSRLSLVTGEACKNIKTNLSQYRETENEMLNIDAEVDEFEHDIKTEFIEDS